jgi:3-oxoadipate CoA-transferase beta subunit
MDLAAAARAVWVIMEHTTKKGAPRLVGCCTLPLTAQRCVKRIFTDIAVVDVTAGGFLVREMLAGLTRDDLQSRSGAPLSFAADLKTLETPEIALPPA